MFTVRLPIDTDKSAEAYFNKCFFYAWKSSNLMVRCAQQRMNALNCDRAYRNAREEYGRKFSGKKTEDLNKDQKRRKKELSALMQEKQKAYGLSKTDFEKIIICTRVVFIGLFIDIFSHPVPISHFSWCV